MPKTILIVDDDELLRRSLAFSLEQSGYKVHTAAKAEDAISYALRDSPDLVLLDIGLPGIDGLEAIRGFLDRKVPVVFLTARRRKLDEVLGLRLGAVDYITKPYDFDVLLARVDACFRRLHEPGTTRTVETVVAGDITVDPKAHHVEVAGRPVETSPREFALLHTFALHPDTVLSVDDLLSVVWGAEFEGQSHVVYTHIRWLRLKIEDDPSDPKRIVTVRGVGYKFIPRD